MEQNKTKQDFIETIHEEYKRAKLQAKSVLKKAKEQEIKQLKDGYRYVQTEKSTWVLRKQK